MDHAASALERIDERARELDLCRHPFLQAWKNGDLDRDLLRQIATRNYATIDMAGRLVSRVHADAVHESTRRVLLSVLNEIEGVEPPSHAELWLRWCASLGLFSDSVREAEHEPDTAAHVQTWTELCASGTVAGVAVLHAYFRQASSLARLQLAGLSHYGMQDGPGRQFFEARIFAAPTLAQRLRDALAALIETAQDADIAVDATERSLRSLGTLCDSVMPATA